MSVDIAVVGGGPSGLFAALGLIRAFDGLKVKVSRWREGLLDLLLVLDLPEPCDKRVGQEDQATQYTPSACIGGSLSFRESDLLTH